MDTKNTRPNQCTRVIDYLSKYGSITSRDAFIHLAIMDLPKRISELRRKGWQINDKTEKVRNSLGETCHIKRYWLEQVAV